MLKFLNTFRKDESGATMVEYGLLVAVIAMVVVIGAVTVGEGITNTFDSASDCASNATLC